MLRSGNEDEGLDEEAEPAAVAGVQVLDLVHACEKRLLFRMMFVPSLS